MILTLDESTHRYSFDGKPVDGLTSTIAEAGLIGDWGSNWYMDRGSKIHLATQYWDEGTLDEETVDPQINGYLKSWITFRHDQIYHPIEIEYKIYNPELRVASTVDRIPLLDLKSGSPEPWHILQIAFQWATLKALYYNGHPLSKSYQQPMDVYLDPEGGPPKVKVYTPAELREAFKAYSCFLYGIRWKRERRIK